MTERIRDFNRYGDNYGQTFYPDFKDEFSISMDPVAPGDVGSESVHPRVHERFGDVEITERGIKE